MDWLIIIGTLIVVVGLAGVVVSAVRVLRSRRSGLDDAALKEVIRKAMVLNVGAFALSALGLMMVVIGVILT